MKIFPTRTTGFLKSLLAVKGIEKGKIEAAEKMISRGMNNADIRDITGLSIKRIEEIRKRVKKK